MKKRFLIVMAIAGALAFGACQEDPAMDELQDQTTEPSEHDPPQIDPPGGKKEDKL